MDGGTTYTQKSRDERCLKPITAPKPVKVSAAFIAGVAIATTVGVLATLAIASLLGDSVSLGDRAGID